jgi:hypothetical protein
MRMTGCAFSGFGIHCISCFRSRFLSLPRGIVGIEGEIVLERILKRTATGFQVKERSHPSAHQHAFDTLTALPLKQEPSRMSEMTTRLFWSL